MSLTSRPVRSRSDHPEDHIVFALDYPSLAEARAGVAAVGNTVGVLKVGLELFVKEGPAALGIGAPYGVDVFADLKLHDIPETVERAISSVAASGARFVTVHASGGRNMLTRAVLRAEKETQGKLCVLAVTVLTSLDDADMAAQGLPGASEHALKLAHLAWSAGVRGFVCSPAEVARLRGELGPDAILVTPGVRPAGAPAHDQKRVATPAEAIASGADFIVVGRPIRDAVDPAACARALALEVTSGLAARAARPS